MVADEAYLTRSMMEPDCEIVAGYKPVMPTFQGKLSAPEAAAIVEFIKTLRTDAPSAEPQKGPIYVPSPASERRSYNTPNYLNAEKGVRSWLTTLDHKRIGVMYLVARRRSASRSAASSPC